MLYGVGANTTEDGQALDDAANSLKFKQDVNQVVESSGNTVISISESCLPHLSMLPYTA